MDELPARHARVDNLAYITADWSDDGTHVLANVRTYDDPSLTLPRHALRWIDVDARTLPALPAGFAEAGAWFRHSPCRGPGSTPGPA